jgi:hypothetical protein
VEVQTDWRFLRKLEYARLLASANEAPPEAALSIKTLTELATKMDSELQNRMLNWNTLVDVESKMEDEVQISLERCLERIKDDLDQIVNYTSLITNRIIN